jgi:hypothetical protein
LLRVEWVCLGDVLREHWALVSDANRQNRLDGEIMKGGPNSVSDEARDEARGTIWPVRSLRTSMPRRDRAQKINDRVFEPLGKDGTRLMSSDWIK